MADVALLSVMQRLRSSVGRAVDVAAIEHEMMRHRRERALHVARLAEPDEHVHLRHAGGDVDLQPGESPVVRGLGGADGGRVVGGADPRELERRGARRRHARAFRAERGVGDVGADDDPSAGGRSARRRAGVAQHEVADVGRARRQEQHVAGARGIERGLQVGRRADAHRASAGGILRGDRDARQLRGGGSGRIVQSVRSCERGGGGGEREELEADAIDVPCG